MPREDLDIRIRASGAEAADSAMERLSKRIEGINKGGAFKFLDDLEKFGKRGGAALALEIAFKGVGNAMDKIAKGEATMAEGLQDFVKDLPLLGGIADGFEKILGVVTGTTRAIADLNRASAAQDIASNIRGEVVAASKASQERIAAYSRNADRSLAHVGMYPEDLARAQVQEKYDDAVREAKRGMSVDAINADPTIAKARAEQAKQDELEKSTSPTITHWFGAIPGLETANPEYAKIKAAKDAAQKDIDSGVAQIQEEGKAKIEAAEKERKAAIEKLKLEDEQEAARYLYQTQADSRAKQVSFLRGRQDRAESIQQQLYSAQEQLNNNGSGPLFAPTGARGGNAFSFAVQARPAEDAVQAEQKKHSDLLEKIRFLTEELMRLQKSQLDFFTEQQPVDIT